MVLRVHSDAGYLNASKGRSRVGGHFYLGSATDRNDTNNHALMNTTGILRMVVSSAAEAEIGALFTNMKEAEIIRTTLAEMGHPQPTTPVQTDNSTAAGIANDTIKQQKTRAIDMRFHWIRDRQRQGNFNIYWDQGVKNMADYYTKHHSPAHHINVRANYVLNALLRTCTHFTKSS